MNPNGRDSFNGTIFHVWKANQPCRIYVTGGQVYFIRRAASAMKPGAAAVIGSQFGLVGGLAVGLANAAAAKRSDLVKDNDLTPPNELLSKHAENHAVRVSDLVDSRLEPGGKYMSFGKNSGRWYFTRLGDAKETVVLLETPDDARLAAFLLSDPAAAAPSAQSENVESESDIVTDLPLPPEHAEVVSAMQALTHVLGQRVPASWQKVRCEVRAASRDNPGPLQVVVGDIDRLDDFPPDTDPATYKAAMHLARKLSPSVKTFPGLVVEMTRLEDGGWRNNIKLVDKTQA